MLACCGLVCLSCNDCICVMATIFGLVVVFARFVAYAADGPVLWGCWLGRGVSDKAGGVDNQTVRTGWRIGESQDGLLWLGVGTVVECIGQLEGTWGSGTSQYLQEEKTMVILLVVASERG